MYCESVLLTHTLGLFFCYKLSAFPLNYRVIHKSVKHVIKLADATVQ